MLPWVELSPKFCAMPLEPVAITMPPVIATSLKVLEMEVGEQKWIDKAQAQTEKLKELVNSLVTLSRMDEEGTPLKFADFDISAAVSETADSFNESSEAAGHRLIKEIAPNLYYSGDEYAVHQLVSILLDNAVKYASPDSPITLKLERDRKGVVIRSSNGCDNMAKKIQRSCLTAFTARIRQEAQAASESGFR